MDYANPNEAQEDGSGIPKEPEAILSWLEHDVTTTKLMMGRATLFKRAAKLFQERDKTAAAERAELQGALFSFLLQSRRKRRPNGHGRFAPMIEMQGTSYPHVAAFTPESLTAFSEELGQSSNPIHRALYADFIWDQRDKYPGPGKEAYEASTTAIAAYLESANIYRHNKWDDQLVDAVDRASELALSIKDTGLIARCIQECFRFAEELITEQSHPAVRWAIDVLETAQNFDQHLSKSDQQRIVPLIQAGADFYAGDRNRHIQHSFLELLARALRALGKAEEAEQARAMSAETFVTEANEADSAIVKLHLLGEAIEAYQQLGNSQRVDELKRSLSEAGVASLSEMKRISVGVTIPREVADAWVNKVLSLDLNEALGFLAASRRFVPDAGEVRSDAANRRSQFPLQYLVSRSTLDAAGHIVQKAGSQDEHVVASEADVYKRIIAMGDWELGRAFDRLESEKGLTTETLMTFLRSGPLFDPATLDVVEVGVQRYFVGDYVSALHILVPQFEDTLRDILARLGQGNYTLTGQVRHGTIFSEKRGVEPCRQSNETNQSEPNRRYRNSLSWNLWSNFPMMRRALNGSGAIVIRRMVSTRIAPSASKNASLSGITPRSSANPGRAPHVPTSCTQLREPSITSPLHRCTCGSMRCTS